MRLALALLAAMLLTGSLAGCTSGYSVPQTASIFTDGSAQTRFTTGRSPTANGEPVELRSSSILAKIHAAARQGQADAVTPGIYVAVSNPGGSTPDSTYVYGYPDPDSSNGPPVCSVGPFPHGFDIAVDGHGDLLVANPALGGLEWIRLQPASNVVATQTLSA